MPETDQTFDLADNYDYVLPKELIAQHPLANREDARLMKIDKSSDAIDHHHIRDFETLLKSGDCLVLNNTKVIPAKLVGYRTLTKGRWQGLFLEADESGNWRILAKTRGKAKVGETVTLQDRHGAERMTLELVTQLDDGSWVVRPDAPGTLEEVLELVGRVPLPNYIRDGNMIDSDVKNYQTIFAKNVGAVAAPTAGLHLTKPLLNRIIDVGVKIAQVTLHVGIGTFKPVAAENLADHKMHYERGSIDEKSVDLINETRKNGGRIIAVGTTSARVLETAAASGELVVWSGQTELFIRPPYEFKCVDGLLTNFHIPRSTLLVMIRTFGGDVLMKRAYSEAIEEKYRFFSYGDAMLIV